MIVAEWEEGDVREFNVAIDRLMPKKLVKREMSALGKRIVNIADEYPPPAGTSSRTGHLKRSWYHKLHGLDEKVGNLAHYAGYVVGDAQRDYHRKRGWKRVFDIAGDEVSKLVKRLEKKAGHIWR